MWLTARITLVFFITLLLGIIAALSVGHQQPEIAATRDIYPCGDHVCVWTIDPAQIGYAEADAIILASPEFKFHNSGHRQADKLVEPYYTIYFPPNVDEVSLPLVSLYFPPYGTLTARALVAKFGVPCAVARFVYPGYLAIYYPHLNIYVEDDSSAEHIHLDSALLVKQIDIFAVGRKSCSASDLYINVPILPWRGFGRY